MSSAWATDFGGSFESERDAVRAEAEQVTLNDRGGAG